MIFGEVYRHNGEWKFKAIGQGYSGGLYALCMQYGVNIGFDSAQPPSALSGVEEFNFRLIFFYNSGAVTWRLVCKRRQR
jgi:hypothetical protein